MISHYRYIDDVFMTTNLSQKEIQKHLDKATQKDSNIKITITISQIIDYLDVRIENLYGHLKTSIYHKSASEPYILPYDSDYPHHIHVNIIYNSLVRAARLCSTVEDFDRERLALEMILLFNGYPPKFIKYHLKYFFQKHNAINVWTELHNRTYQKLHENLLYTLTRRERRIKTQQDNMSMNQDNNNKHKDQIYLHYTFENGPLLKFNKEFRSIWEKYYVYPGSRFKNTRLILSPILNRTLQSLLIHKKPSKILLTQMETTIPTTSIDINP